MSILNKESPYASSAYTAQTTVSRKSFVVHWLFALLLGGLAIDRFYLGKVGTGILKLITFGGFGIWVLIDVILALTGTTRDKQGLTLAGYEQNKMVAIIVSIVVFALSFLGGASNAASVVAELTY